MRVIFATVLFGVRISISCQLINVDFVKKMTGSALLAFVSKFGKRGRCQSEA